MNVLMKGFHSLEGLSSSSLLCHNPAINDMDLTR